MKLTSFDGIMLKSITLIALLATFAAPASAELILRAVPDSAVFPERFEVGVVFILQNEGDTPLLVQPLSGSVATIQVEVEDPSGNHQTLTFSQTDLVDLVKPAEPVTLEPGQLWGQRIALSDQMDFSSPGTYQIQITYQAGGPEETSQKIWTGALTSEPVPIVIAPTLQSSTAPVYSGLPEPQSDDPNSVVMLACEVSPTVVEANGTADFYLLLEARDSLVLYHHPRLEFEPALATYLRVTLEDSEGGHFELMPSVQLAIPSQGRIRWLGKGERVLLVFRAGGASANCQFKRLGAESMASGAYFSLPPAGEYEVTATIQVPDGDAERSCGLTPIPEVSTHCAMKVGSGFSPEYP